MSFFIDKEMRALIPPLSEEELDQLEENILAEGIRDPLVTWPQPDGREMLIDGHNRFDISCRHNGIPFQVKQIDFPDKETAKRWIILNQFGRRNLSAYDRSVLALKLKPLIAEQAKKRMSEAPQKKAEREKEIKKIWENHDFDTARNLVALKRQAYGHEDRAKLMASGKFIYFARFDGNKLKIGSSVCPEDRVKQLAISCPGLELIEAVFYGEGAEKHENAIKKKYGQYRFGSECYQCSDEILSQIIAFTKKEAGRKNNTDYELAQIAGVSHDTIHKVEKIEEKASDRTKQLVREGKLSINQAYNSVHPKRPNPIKEMVKDARKKHEEYLETKKEKTVDFQQAQADKENMEIIHTEMMQDILKALNAVDRVGLLYKSKELDGIGSLLDEKEKAIISDRCNKCRGILLMIQNAIINE